MKNIIVSFAVIGSTLLLSNCALIELPFKAVSSVLDTTSSVIKSTTGAATNAASNAAPFFLEHTEEDAPSSEESLQDLQSSPELEKQQLEPSLPTKQQALVFVAN